MIDLEAMKRDPWSTWPVKKEDMLQLASSLESMERIANVQHQIIMNVRDKLGEILEIDPMLIGSASKMRVMVNNIMEALR